jgi:hypothetical protein
MVSGLNLTTDFSSNQLYFYQNNGTFYGNSGPRLFYYFRSICAKVYVNNTSGFNWIDSWNDLWWDMFYWNGTSWVQITAAMLGETGQDGENPRNIERGKERTFYLNHNTSDSHGVYRPSSIFCLRLYPKAEYNIEISTYGFGKNDIDNNIILNTKETSPTGMFSTIPVQRIQTNNDTLVSSLSDLDGNIFDPNLMIGNCINDVSEIQIMPRLNW